MKPEQVELLVNAIEHENNSTWLYVLISLLVILGPLLIWAVRIVFRASISDLINKSIKPQIELLEESFETNKKANTQMFTIMEMHIEELRHIKENVTKNTEEIEKIKRA